MGATHVTVAIRNPAEPDRVWEGLFLVDTGATDCLVPRSSPEVHWPATARKANLRTGRRQRNPIRHCGCPSRVHGRVRRRNHPIRRRRHRAPAGRDRAGVRRYRGGPPQSDAETSARRTAQRLPAPTRHVLAHHHNPESHPPKAANPHSPSQRARAGSFKSSCAHRP